ncbi:MAG: hypothetical protein FJ217_08720 [Ignavibacteria bacterium]|nr:hypothetical protein [Ignavibacteria bacterium]
MIATNGKWPLVTLGSVIGSDGLFTDGDWILSQNMDDEGSIRLIQLADVGVGTFLNKSSKFITQHKKEELGCTLVKPGDILISRMADPIARACIVPDLHQEAIAAVDLSIVRVDRRIVDPRYVVIICNSSIVRNQAVRLGRGTTRMRISRTHLESIRIPLPPLPIQKQIAAILEKADAAREKRRQANQLTEEFLQSLFLEMFGDPVTNPKGWQTKNLGEIARREKFSIVDGPFGSHLKANEYTDSGVRVIRVNNIKPNSFNFDDVRYVSLQKYDSIKRSTVRPGDIIMAKVGNTIGKTCVFPKSIDFAVLTANVCKISADDAISDAVFISRQMNFEAVQTTIRNLSGDTAKPMIILPRLKQLKLIVPPLSEQRKFTHSVEKVESLRGKQRESEKELENLFNSLMQRAFRGELVG